MRKKNGFEATTYGSGNHCHSRGGYLWDCQEWTADNAAAERNDIYRRKGNALSLVYG